MGRWADEEVCRWAGIYLQVKLHSLQMKKFNNVENSFRAAFVDSRQRIFQFGKILTDICQSFRLSEIRGLYYKTFPYL